MRLVPGTYLRVLTIIAVATPASVDSTSAQQQDPLPLTRLSSPVILDGFSDEPAWNDVPTFPLTVYTPTFQSPPTERTEIRVAYNDEFLYVSGRLYDSDTSGIRANTLYRDQYSGDDVFSILLDSYNDNETAVWFSTSPAGVLSDRSVSNDAEFLAGRPMNSDWNTFWDVATAQTEEGWFAEMRIPFSSIGFQDIDGQVTMGMILYRFIARKNERQIFPAIPPNWGMGFAKPSQARRVTLEGVRSRQPVYVTPYALGGIEHRDTLNTAGTAYVAGNDLTNELGVDIKYNPTNNLTLDITANTDFAQVEADDQQVNLTRFSLFFPEKRQFFQSRAGLFEFNTGGFSRLFHSRQIGLNGGRPVRILGGARLVGRIGNTDIGMLNMQTARVDQISPENFGVLRLRRQVFNRFSNVGGMATTRIGENGEYNMAVGTDAIVRPFGDEYLTLKWIRTFEDNSPGTSLLDASRVIAGWERRNSNGLSYSGSYIRSGTAYNPGVGFQIRQDFSFGRTNMQYKWFQGDDSPFRSVAVKNLAQAYARNGDKTVESASIEPALELELKNGGNLTFTFKNNYESVRDTFTVSGEAQIVPGDYWYREGEAKFRAPFGALLRGEYSLTAGSFFDGWRVGLLAGPTWNVSRHLELSGSYELNVIRFSDRSQSLNAHLLRLKVQTAFDIHFSINTFLQYDSVTDDASVNARLRYHFREGNDLWIVYNEGLNIDRNPLLVPRRPLSQGRVLLLKYTHTFIQ